MHANVIRRRTGRPESDQVSAATQRPSGRHLDSLERLEPLEPLEPRRLLSVAMPSGLPASLLVGQPLDGAVYVGPDGRFETADFDLDPLSFRPEVDPASDVLFSTLVADATSVAPAFADGTGTIEVALDSPSTADDVVPGLYDGDDNLIAYADDVFGADERFTVTVDPGVSPPAPAVPFIPPDLRAEDDSGVFDDDDVTNLPDGTPSLTVFNANALPAFGRLYRDGVVVGTQQVPALGDAVVDDLAPPGADGTYSYTYTLAFTQGGPESPLSPPTTVTLDRAGPTQRFFSFRFNDGPQDHRFFVNFSEPLNDFTLDDVVVTNITTGETLPAGHFELRNIRGGDHDLTYNPTAENDVLPDGAYEVTVVAGAATDIAGNPSEAFFGSDFFVSGDATRDGKVNLLDFNVLALNFGLGGRNFTDADFNYDGLVNLLDFNVLAGRFGFDLGLTFTVQREVDLPARGRAVDLLRTQEVDAALMRRR